MAADYFRMEGIPLYTDIISDVRSLRDEFAVRDEDVIILSYPKSGTSWIKEIVNLLHAGGDPSWVQSVVSWGRSPCVETREGLELTKKQQDPGSYSSHLPVQLFPKSLFTSKAK
ncbi:bile salt sulfotransferase-like, partial [Myotis lucifugus]|uniref:bile salt sulfotransferase-like n=1 Tax=Myotis lucifugus TaxID=59463 RepID=UPI0006D7263B